MENEHGYFTSKLAKPAQRAIRRTGITTIEQLSKHSEKEIVELHGIGKNV